MSSAIVIPSVVSLRSDKKEFMIYEATFSDILGIMFFNFLIENVGVNSANTVVYSIIGNIVITIIISVAISYAMVILFQRLVGDVKLFMLIAVLVLLYAIGKQMHLSSLVIILVFGLAINNSHIFFVGKLREFIDESMIKSILKDLHLVTRESAFVVRTFFFVVFGTTIDLRALLNLEVLLVSLLIVVVFYASRYILLKAFFLKKSIFPEFFITPRGLITVLLFFSIPVEITSDVFNADIILITILATSFIMTWGLIKFNKTGVSEHSFSAAKENEQLSYFLQRMSGEEKPEKKEIIKSGDQVELDLEKSGQRDNEDESKDSSTDKKTDNDQ